MVFEALDNLGKRDLRDEKFQKALEFLQRDDLAELPIGGFELCPGVVVQVQGYTTLPAEQIDFETHDRHFDIQYVVSGLEGIGVVDRRALEPKGEYNAANDIAYWQEPKTSSMLVLHPGEYAILAPEDGHKPRCMVGAPCEVRKIVLKVEA